MRNATEVYFGQKYNIDSKDRRDQNRIQLINKSFSNIHCVIAITCLLLCSCFVINHELFNGLISAKHLWVQMVGISVFFMAGVRLLFIKRISLNIIDISVLFMCIWMIGREYFSTMPYANFEDNSLVIMV